MAEDRRNSETRPFVTKAEKDAALLRSAWERTDKIRLDKGLPKLSRKALASVYGVTAGMISHYLRAQEPLNIKWQLRFADHIGMAASDIWPDFPHKNLAHGKIPQEASDLALDLLELEGSDLQVIQAMMKSLKKAHAAANKPPKPDKVTPIDALDSDEIQRRDGRTPPPGR